MNRQGSCKDIIVYRCVIDIKKYLFNKVLFMDFTFKNFAFETYDDLKPYYDELLSRNVTSIEETKEWIKNCDDLEAQISENIAWKYINKTCDTTNKEYEKAYMYFIQEISPKLQEVSDLVNKKIITLTWIEELAQNDTAYMIWYRSIKKSLDMYREENIPLHTQDAEKSSKYWEITWTMNIEYQWETLTIPQAMKYLEDSDRSVRKELYEKIWARRLQDKDILDWLMNELIQIRNRIAINGWYSNYATYAWDARGRFDYTQEHVFDYHKGIKQHIVPIVHGLFEEKKSTLWLDTLKPYDISAPLPDEQQLKPFTTWDELLEKGIATMRDVYNEFWNNLEVMKAAWRFDLNSRSWKAPWWYNYPMAVSHYPFIFMNAAGTHRDVETFVHEAGHAMHSFCMKDIELQAFRDYPIEVAEVASMSMELVTMNFWNHFYKDNKQVIQAKKEQVSWVLETLTRVAIVDSFQHRLYTKPTHTVSERDEKFSSLLAEYQPWIDYADTEEIARKRRQAQLHIFEIPFYYIEYGISQLGAIWIWKQYIENPENAMKNYIDMLSLGNTRPIPELYKAWWLEFDFSPEKISSLSKFVISERNKLQ